MLRRIRAKLAEPVVTNRSVDLMAALVYACYAGWGISSSIAGLPTIAKTTTPLYELAWSSSVGLLSAIAFIAAVVTFLPTREIRVRIRRKTTEMIAALLLVSFVAVYPIMVFTLAFGGDGNRISLFFVALSYLIVPAWRSLHLYSRIRKLRDGGHLAVGTGV